MPIMPSFWYNQIMQPPRWLPCELGLVVGTGSTMPLATMASKQQVAWFSTTRQSWYLRYVGRHECSDNQLIFPIFPQLSHYSATAAWLFKASTRQTNPRGIPRGTAQFSSRFLDRILTPMTYPLLPIRPRDTLKSLPDDSSFMILDDFLISKFHVTSCFELNRTESRHVTPGHTRPHPHELIEQRCSQVGESMGEVFKDMKESWNKFTRPACPRIGILGHWCKHTVITAAYGRCCYHLDSWVKSHMSHVPLFGHRDSCRVFKRPRILEWEAELVWWSDSPVLGVGYCDKKIGSNIALDWPSSSWEGSIASHMQWLLVWFLIDYQTQVQIFAVPASI